MSEIILKKLLILVRDMAEELSSLSVSVSSGNTGDGQLDYYTRERLIGLHKRAQILVDTAQPSS